VVTFSSTLEKNVDENWERGRLVRNERSEQSARLRRVCGRAVRAPSKAAAVPITLLTKRKEALARSEIDQSGPKSCVLLHQLQVLGLVAPCLGFDYFEKASFFFPTPLCEIWN
jgi:hypothetical protein